MDERTSEEQRATRRMSGEALEQEAVSEIQKWLLGGKETSADRFNEILNQLTNMAAFSLPEYPTDAQELYWYSVRANFWSRIVARVELKSWEPWNAGPFPAGL